MGGTKTRYNDAGRIMPDKGDIQMSFIDACLWTLVATFAFAIVVVVEASPSGAACLDHSTAAVCNTLEK